MNRLVLVLLFALATLVQAKMLDGIAYVVEGEAITTSEIAAVQSQRGISKTEAVDMLIVNRLQKSALKNINIPEDDVDKRILGIAKQNKLSVKKMQSIIKKQGTDWSEYRSSIKSAMKKEKFYREQVLSSIPDPSDEELKRLYEKHKQELVIPSRINVLEYSAQSKEKIESFAKNHEKKYVSVRSLSKKSKEMSPDLLSMLLSANIGDYTEPLNTGSQYIIYKIKSKSGRQKMSFDLARSILARKWKQNQQSKMLVDYFKKLKTKANIQKIR